MSKMIKVKEDTHKKVKEKAKEKGMTMQGYIDYLLSIDNNNYRLRRWI